MISKKLYVAMRKSLDLCEVRACLRKRSSSLDVAIKQNKSSRAMACGDLGNKLFFLHAAVASAANDACEEDQCRVTSLKSPIPAMESWNAWAIMPGRRLF